MTTTMPRRFVIAGAVLSLAAALLHFQVMPEHFAEWWGYGAFFLVVAKITEALLIACLVLLLHVEGWASQVSAGAHRRRHA